MIMNNEGWENKKTLKINEMNHVKSNIIKGVVISTYEYVGLGVALVGLGVGFFDSCVGARVGVFVGDAVGGGVQFGACEIVGRWVGDAVVGVAEGAYDGVGVGGQVNDGDFDMVGLNVGERDGSWVGISSVGNIVGNFDGLLDTFGGSDGYFDGLNEGSSVGGGT